MDAAALTRAPQHLALAPPTEPPPTATGGGGEPGFQAFGADGFTFLDFIDIINPLQHIPLVATLYRSLSGDSIDPGSRIAGGTLFGGPIGAGLAVANVVVEFNTGKDMGDHVVALFEGGPVSPSPQPPTRTAGVPSQDETDHAEVRRWAEQEAAYRATQEAALSTTRPGPASLAIAPSWNDAVLVGRTPPPAVAADTAIAVQALADASASPPPGTRLDTWGGIPLGTVTVTSIAPPASSAGAVPPGALAANGGWFSETMLSALTRYQESQRLADLMVAEKNLAR